MAYNQDLKTAARRHLKAGQVLYEQDGAGTQPGCRGVAGYLFGIAGEIAVKALMRASGMLPLRAEERREDPYYAHFPALRGLLSTAQGRRAGELLQIHKDPSLFQNWDTEMRYAHTGEIKDAWVDAWKASAEKLVDRMAIE